MKEVLVDNIEELFSFLEREYGTEWYNKVAIDILSGAESSEEGKMKMKVRISDLDELSSDVKIENLSKILNESETFDKKREKTTESLPKLPHFEIDISQDKMKAYLTIYPGLEREIPTLDEISQFLQEKGVIYGVKRDEIKKILEDRCILKPVLVAEGEEPIPPQDANFKLLFPSSGMILSSRKEGGKTDYASMYEIAYCHKGDKLLEKFPPKEGKNGRDVFGKEIPVPKAKDINLKKFIGKNAEISKDGMFILASIDGQPFLSEDGKVNVNEIFIVNGDLDYSVGNITFPGTIWIKGNCEENFKIKSDKDVLIDGVVGDTKIEAKGAILIKGGVFGKHKGLLIAHKHFKAKFLSEATVISYGDIEVDEYIMNSRVISNGTITVNGKGWISGGSVKASFDVIANVIGNVSKIRTHVSAGVNFDSSRKKEELKNDLKIHLKKLGEVSVFLNKILNSFKEAKDEKRKRYLLDLLNHLRKEKIKILKEVQNLRKALELLAFSYKTKVKKKDSKIIVKQKCFEGTRITIGDESINVYFDIGPTIFSYDKIAQKILAIPYKKWK